MRNMENSVTENTHVILRVRVLIYIAMGVGLLMVRHIHVCLRALNTTQ